MEFWLDYLMGNCLQKMLCRRTEDYICGRLGHTWSVTAPFCAPSVPFTDQGKARCCISI